jgi:hypothetical protein
VSAIKPTVLDALNLDISREIMVCSLAIMSALRGRVLAALE